MISILTAFAAVTVVGLVAGVLLALAAHFLSVPENETVNYHITFRPVSSCFNYHKKLSYFGSHTRSRLR